GGQVEAVPNAKLERLVHRVARARRLEPEVELAVHPCLVRAGGPVLVAFAGDDDHPQDEGAHSSLQVHDPSCRGIRSRCRSPELGIPGLWLVEPSRRAQGRFTDTSTSSKRWGAIIGTIPEPRVPRRTFMVVSDDSKTVWANLSIPLYVTFVKPSFVQTRATSIH